MPIKISYRGWASWSRWATLEPELVIVDSVPQLGLFFWTSCNWLLDQNPLCLITHDSAFVLKHA
jgi:hypothetical protein